MRHGQDVPFERIDLEEARSVAPVLSPRVSTLYRMGGQRYIDPGAFCEALAADVRRRGGSVVEGVEVVAVTSTRTPAVKLATGEWRSADVVVVATGAWLLRWCVAWA